MDTAASELNLGALLPNLTTVIGWIELVAGLAVMAGPILMLVFGLIYWLIPPKEANYGLGYRFWWGMSSLEAWKFTQRLAGMVWTGLGGVLTIVMGIVCLTLGKLNTLDMVWRAGVCLIWELALIAVACIAINVVVMIKFDKDGFRRGETEE